MEIGLVTVLVYVRLQIKLRIKMRYFVVYYYVLKYNVTNRTRSFAESNSLNHGFLAVWQLLEGKRIYNFYFPRNHNQIYIKFYSRTVTPQFLSFFLILNPFYTSIESVDC
jgi:hypothetical protein